MCILINYRWAGTLLCLGAASLLFGTAAISLSQAKGQTKEAPDAWGPDRDGLRTRLFPAQEKFAVGGPARFRLKMKNSGDKRLTYDSQGVNVNGSIQVTDPDGKPVRYIGGSFQTAGGPKPIAPGETVVLFDEFDLTDQYLFVKAGFYTLQFRGQKDRSTWARTRRLRFRRPAS